MTRNPRYDNGHRRRLLRARVLAAYDVCAICGQPVDKSLRTPDPMSPEVDEIIPVSRGGDPYKFRNCQLVHRKCNQLKGNHTTEWAREKAAGREPVEPTSIPFRKLEV